MTEQRLFKRGNSLWILFRLSKAASRSTQGFRAVRHAPSSGGSSWERWLPIWCAGPAVARVGRGGSPFARYWPLRLVAAAVPHRYRHPGADLLVGATKRGVKPLQASVPSWPHRKNKSPQTVRPAGFCVVGCAVSTGLLRRGQALTCPCRPCHPCRPCRACRHQLGRHPSGPQPPWLRSSAAAMPRRQRFAGPCG